MAYLGQNPNYFPTMKRSLLFCFAMALQPLSATQQVVTLGDSLTFAYETEFCNEIDTPFFSYGDGFSSNVRNWAEILNKSAYRKDSFDLGTRQYVNFDGPFGTEYDFFFRNKNNW